MTECKLPPPKEDEGAITLQELQRRISFNRYPRQFGPWIVDPEVLVLRNEQNGYEVDLEKIGTREELLFWIFHMSRKNPHVYGGCQYMPQLIHALEHIYGKTSRKEDKWDATKVAKKYCRKAWPRREVPLKLRHQILERDGFRCCDCGATPSPTVKLHVDHRVPLAMGGTNDPSNLRTLCQDCNLGKGARRVDYPSGHG